MSILQSTGSTVIKTIDGDTGSAVIALNQKLKSLQMEIKSKLATLADNAAACNQKKSLLILSDEVARALESINKVVSIVDSDDQLRHDFLEHHHDELEKFREMVITNTEMIANIKTKP